MVELSWRLYRISLEFLDRHRPEADVNLYAVSLPTELNETSDQENSTGKKLRLKIGAWLNYFKEIVKVSLTIHTRVSTKHGSYNIIASFLEVVVKELFKDTIIH